MNSHDCDNFELLIIWDSSKSIKISLVFLHLFHNFKMILILFLGKLRVIEVIQVKKLCIQNRIGGGGGDIFIQQRWVLG